MFHWQFVPVQAAPLSCYAVISNEIRAPGSPLYVPKNPWMVVTLNDSVSGDSNDPSVPAIVLDVAAYW